MISNRISSNLQFILLCSCSDSFHVLWSISRRPRTNHSLAVKLVKINCFLFSRSCIVTTFRLVQSCACVSWVAQRRPFAPCWSVWRSNIVMWRRRTSTSTCNLPTSPIVESVSATRDDSFAKNQHLVSSFFTMDIFFDMILHVMGMLTSKYTKY